MTLQTDASGALKHLLTLDHLPHAQLTALLDRAQHFAEGHDARGALAGTAVCTLFFEPSTRTRMSFQLAAQRLGADVLSFDASTSSASECRWNAGTPGCTAWTAARIAPVVASLASARRTWSVMPPKPVLACRKG